MDRYALEGKLGLISYCQICENINNSDTIKTRHHQNLNLFIKEENKMIVTIIGSLKKKEQIKECKEFFERFGHTVNSPCDSRRELMPLLTKQSSWIEKIEGSDLVVAIPKEIRMQEGNFAEYIHEFGESTSYEMAIAFRFDKRVIIW